MLSLNNIKNKKHRRSISVFVGISVLIALFFIGSIKGGNQVGKDWIFFDSANIKGVIIQTGGHITRFIFR